MERRTILMLFFDSPMQSLSERRSYYRFSKYLKKSGYLPVQRSVYVKLLQNGSALSSEMNSIDRYATSGSVFALPLSMQQFGRLIALRGENFDLCRLTDDILYV